MAEPNSSNAALGLHPNANNLMGQKFDLLEVIAFTGKRKRGYLVWLCLCKCGNTIELSSQYLGAGQRSCGCIMSPENLSAWATTHGMTDSPEWIAWRNMIVRCTDPKCDSWGNYGGRGIRVCDRWLESFENFYADMGKRPSNRHSLDRYPDQNGNYEKSNCRWATAQEQNTNRCTTVILDFQGQSLSISQWERLLGLKHGLINDRLKSGWSVERALTTPARRKRR